LKYTSVVIQPYSAECSKCQAEFKTVQEVREHEHIKNGSGYEVVTSFTFHRVDFVDIPAYPQAGVVDLAASAEQGEQTLLPLYAAFYESQAQAQSQPGPNQVLNNQTIQEGTQMADEFKEKIAALEQTIKDEQIKRAAAESKATEAETAMTAIKAQLDQIVKEKHDNLVAEVYKARVEAGLTGKEETEDKKLLASIDDKTLSIMKNDALKVAQKVASLESPGPKTKFGQNSTEEANQLKAKIEETRRSMGFAPKTSKEEA